MARPLALAAAIAVSLLFVSGAAGAATQQTPKRGGTVLLGVPATLEPPCFNLLLPACYAGGPVVLEEIADHLLFARPFELGPGLIFRPDVVSDVTVTKSPFTLTYHIRPEARWSDGIRITSRDFQFTYQAIRSTPPGVVSAEDPIRKISGLRILDARTFRVRLEGRIPPSVWKLWPLFPVPSHVLAGRDLSTVWLDRVDDPRTGNPIGSGPFLMQSRQRGRQITFVRNPRHRGPHGVYLDRIVFRFFPADELAEALRRGQVDVILPLAASESAAREVRLRPPAGVKVVSTPGLFWEHLAFRVGPGGHPALRNKLVRRALAYGIDRAALVRILENRFGRSAPRLAPLQSVVYPARNPDYEPSWDRYRYRPALARRLLAQAGCRPGTGGIRICGGERLVVIVGTTAGNDRRVAALETIQTQLRSIGVDVRPQFLPVVAAVTRALAAGHLDGALFASFFDLNDLQARFGCGGGDNHTGHCSRLVTRELDNAARVVDDESQARALKRAEHQLAQDVPILPLFRAPSLVAYRTAIRNFVPEDVLWNVEDWWLER